jgi:hypothetical protein
MKKGILLLVLLVSMVSCENDSLMPSKVTAFINGDTWKSITQVATIVSDKLNITATDAQGRIISMVVNGTSKGTYELNVAKQQCELVYKATPTNSADYYGGVSGTITITAASSTQVSGTFDFVCTRSLVPAESITITNGQFTNLKIINY